jgi:hypothetical protein
MPSCICDANGSASITATDGLVCLKFAVGQAVALDCLCPISTTSTTSTTMIAGDSLRWGIGDWDLESWGVQE